MGLKWLWFCLVSAAAFFVTYDCTKSLLGAGGVLAAPHVAPVTHMLAASLGEIVSPLFPHSSLDFCLPSFGFLLLFHSAGPLSGHVYLCSNNSFSVVPFLEGQLPLALVVAFPRTRSSLFVSFPPLYCKSQMKTTGMSVNVIAFPVSHTTM